MIIMTAIATPIPVLVRLKLPWMMRFPSSSRLRGPTWSGTSTGQSKPAWFQRASSRGVACIRAFFGLESHMAWGEIQQKIPHPKKWLIEIFANPVPSVVIHRLGRFKATVHRRM